MPLSAVDAMTPAFQHAKQQLFQPFRFGQWVRLAIVGFFAGELGSGGGGNFGTPPSHQGSGGTPGMPHIDPALFAGIIVTLIVAAVILIPLFIYLNSMFRFVLFDSVVAKQCRIREYWSRRTGPGFRYFLWQVSVLLCFLAALVILVGVPVLIALSAGWFKQPREHLVPLILGGILMLFVLVALTIGMVLVSVLTKDFVVPQMALEDIGAVEGWRRLWAMMKAEKGGYFAYIGMKIVLAIGAGIVIGIATLIVFLIILIPVGGVGVAAVIMAKAAGATWNALTITAVIVAACVVIALLVFIVALISVPAIVFFPAYSIHFFAARYLPLYNLMHPAPPTPPLMPAPAPVG